MNNIQKTDKSLTEYRKHLDAEFVNRWEEIARAKTSMQSKKQDQLYDFDEKQGRLI